MSKSSSFPHLPPPPSPLRLLFSLFLITLFSSAQYVPPLSHAQTEQNRPPPPSSLFSLLRGLPLLSSPFSHRSKKEECRLPPSLFPLPLLEFSPHRHFLRISEGGETGGGEGKRRRKRSSETRNEEGEDRRRRRRGFWLGWVVEDGVVEWRRKRRKRRKPLYDPGDRHPPPPQLLRRRRRRQPAVLFILKA